MPRDASVPMEIFIAFPKALVDEEAKKRIKQWWMYGNDKQIVNMDLMFANELTCIYRPSGLKIDWVNLLVTTLTPSGLQIIIPNVQLQKLGDTTAERVSNLNDYMFVKFNKQKRSLVASEVVPLRGVANVELAKEIMENSKYSPLELLIMGLGYRPENEIKRLYIPRFLTWFKGYDGKPMHICQFTLPESGKTTFGLRNETLFNWRYIPEPPTLARLILDARSGTLGEVFLRNGIVFDEFDKWTIDQHTTRATFDAILTGMEQGKWERGVSAGGVRVPDVPRLIPLTFFGNLGDFEKLYGATTYNTRAFFNVIYTARLGHDVRALCDRLSVVDACYKQIRIMDYLTFRVLPDAIIRGIVKYLQNSIKPCNISHLSGRLKRHSNSVYGILSMMMEITPEFADGLVGGGLDMDKTMKLKEPEKKIGFVPERR